MARKNKFMEQETDFVGMLNEESSEDNLTKSIVRELNEHFESENEILTAPANMFIPYEDEKLRLDLHHGEVRERLKESIKLNGIFTPVICTKKDDKLMILSGHNRVDIAKEINVKVPYILKNNITQEEMELICIDDNLIHRQRTDYKPMQLAYLIKVKMDAEKHQGRTLGTEFPKYTGDKIGEEHALTRRMIGKYLKLNNLIDLAKNMVDDKIITISTGYELAFFEPEIQDVFLASFQKYKINEKILKEIRKQIQEEKLKTIEEKKDYILKLLNSSYVQKEKKRIFDFRNIRKFIPEDIDESNTENYVIEAIKHYNKIRNN